MPNPFSNPTRPHSAPLGPTLSHLTLPVSEDFYFKRILLGPNACPTPSQPHPAPLSPTRPHSAPLGPTLSHLALPVSEYFLIKRI